MSRQNPFKKADRGKKWVKLLISGGSGGGKTLTALQIACHMAITLGRPGSVAVIDTEDGSADLYSHDSVIDEPYRCACEQCIKSGKPIALEFDHVDLRDHSPQETQRTMRAAVDNEYAILVLDSASHEWCGVNGCLEQVDALKGDGRGQKTNNAWNSVTQLHNAFLSDIRAIPIHLIATARTKPGRGDDAGCEIIIQRDKDGPFEYEFGFWGSVNRNTPGTLHVEKSRSGHFQGDVWKRAGQYTAEQFMLWAGHVRQAPPQPTSTPPADGGRAVEPVERSTPARLPGTKEQKRDPETCKHPHWSPAQKTDSTGLVVVGAACDDCGKFSAEEAPPEETPTHINAHCFVCSKGPDQGDDRKLTASSQGVFTHDECDDQHAANQSEELEQIIESIAEVVALPCLSKEIVAPYKAELVECDKYDTARLSNLLACLMQVVLIAECIEKVDEKTAKTWKGHVAAAGMDLSKLEKMVPWCQQKIPAATT